MSDISHLFGPKGGSGGALAAAHGAIATASVVKAVGDASAWSPEVGAAAAKVTKLSDALRAHQATAPLLALGLSADDTAAGGKKGNARTAWAGLQAEAARMAAAHGEACEEMFHALRRARTHAGIEEARSFSEWSAAASASKAAGSLPVMKEWSNRVPLP